jgi:hypothetical protein
MSSSMGRFFSADPITVTPGRIADPQQLNLYSYVKNNPLVLTDPTGMIIDTSDLSDEDRESWERVVAVANQKDANGNYVHPALHDAYARLDSDSRVFKIENDKSLGQSEAGRFEITKFNGPNDFSEAKVELNFNVIKGISSTTMRPTAVDTCSYGDLAALQKRRSKSTAMTRSPVPTTR